MFDQFLQQLELINPDLPVTIIMPAHAPLPHAATLARKGIKSVHDTNLEALAQEAGVELASVPEDAAMQRLYALSGHAFFALGAAYRAKLKCIVEECGLAELQSLYEKLVKYEEYKGKPRTRLALTQETANPVELGKYKLMTDAGLPLPDTDWPHTRTKLTYQQLHYPKLFRNYQQTTLLLPTNNAPKTILDAGLGDGVALAEFKSENTLTIGIGLNSIDAAYSNNIDSLCYSPIPNGQHARELFDVLRGRIDLVFDTYGPGTYANNPIHALIYLGLLLTEKGSANIIISSVYGESADQSPIGYAATRQRLIAFFKNELNLNMMIRRTIINSAVESGVVCKDFHVVIKREQYAPARTESLDHLFALADHAIGKPCVIPKKSAWGNFKNGHRIEGRAYGDDVVPYVWQKEIDSVQMDYIIQNGVGVRFHFQFGNQIASSQFAIQFSEFFIYHQNPDWQVNAFHPDFAITTTYFDKAQDEETLRYQFRSADNGWAYLHQEGMQAESPALPVYTADNIKHCVQQGCRQLYQAFADIPGITQWNSEKLNIDGSVIPLYAQQGFNLFTPKQTARTVNRLENQYLLSMLK